MSDLLVEYVIGWRRWSTAPHYSFVLSRPHPPPQRSVEEGLFPLTRRGRWVPGWNEAGCWPDVDLYTTMLSGKGGSGVCRGLCSAKCACGLYAYHNRGPDAYPTSPTVFTQGRVLGLVLAYGKMAVHHHGFRARYAKPLVLVRPRPDRVSVQRVADDYGIPLADTLEEAHEFALKYGQPVPESLRPEESEHALPIAQARARARAQARAFKHHAGLLSVPGYHSHRTAPTWTVENRKANQ